MLNGTLYYENQQFIVSCYKAYHSRGLRNAHADDKNHAFGRRRSTHKVACMVCSASSTKYIMESDFVKTAIFIIVKCPF